MGHVFYHPKVKNSNTSVGQCVSKSNNPTREIVFDHPGPNCLQLTWHNMSPCLLIFGTKEKQMRKMFIILGEPILAGEQSQYSGMQFKIDQNRTYNMSTHSCLPSTCLPDWIPGNFALQHLHFLAVSGFHRGCTLGTLLATPPKVGVTVWYVKWYWHWV